MPTLSIRRDVKPSRFKITCTSSKTGRSIAFEIDAPDVKEAFKEARNIILLGKFKVEPV